MQDIFEMVQTYFANESPFDDASMFHTGFQKRGSCEWRLNKKDDFHSSGMFYRKAKLQICGRLSSSNWKKGEVEKIVFIPIYYIVLHCNEMKNG